MNEPLPAPETMDVAEPTTDSEVEPSALPMCGSICPSAGSS
jgi:serine/threonine kinase 32